MTDAFANARRRSCSAWNLQTVLVLAVAWVVCFSAAGAVLIFGAEPLSGDEVLAVFGAEMLKLGHFAMPIPEQWREFIPAIATKFHLIASDGSAWASGYLPGNSALRALFDLSVGAIWCSPILAAVAILATYGTARRLWPDKSSGPIAAAVLLATSPQVLVTAMTPFAMTSHLAVNAVWLWLFVINRPASHLAAIALGALGTGLHQYLFHPLFVGPFVLLLMTQRRWGLATLYSLAYGAIVLMWMRFPGWLFIDQGPVLSKTLLGGVWNWLRQAQADQFQHSLIAQFAVINIGRLILGLGPVFAFLLIKGAGPTFRAGGILTAGLLGAVLSFVVFQGLIPNPGYTWGYRYLHGQLGVLALVAAAGWLSLSPSMAGMRIQAIAAAGAALAIVTLCVTAYQTMKPVRAAMKHLRALHTDMVIIDDPAILMGFDLVRNSPTLLNRPMIMTGSSLSDDQIIALCRRGTVAFFTAQEASTHGYNVMFEKERPMRCSEN